MNPKEAERVRGQVGLTPDEVKELNRTKESKSKSRMGQRLANTAAAGVAGVLAGTFVEQIHQAVNNPPPARVEEVKPDPKRDIPPEGITFPQDTGRKDAPFDPARGRYFLFQG